MRQPKPKLQQPLEKCDQRLDSTHQGDLFPLLHGHGEDESDRPLSKRVIADLMQTALHEKHDAQQRGDQQRRTPEIPEVSPSSCSSTTGLNCLEMAAPDEVIAGMESSTRVRVAMDSAAVDNVIHPDELPEDAEYQPNTSGKHFVGANNAHIENFGSCQTKMTQHGDVTRADVGCDWRMADVSRPLHSVAKVAGPKGGPGNQDVLFDNDSCFVVAPGTVKKLMRTLAAVAEYKREGNLYIADMTLSSFGRQDAKA